MTQVVNGNYASIQKENGLFVVFVGYVNLGCENDAYGQKTCTGRFKFASEKAAKAKAQKHLGV